MSIPIIGSILSIFDKAADKLIPDTNKRAEFKQDIMMALIGLDLGQMKINEKEAENPSIFVSGWRPAVGWVCVIALGLNYILFPMIEWILTVWPPEGDIIEPPKLEMHELMTLLLGLLGMGTLRTVDKAKGTARHKI